MKQPNSFEIPIATNSFHLNGALVGLKVTAQMEMNVSPQFSSSTIFFSFTLNVMSFTKCSILLTLSSLLHRFENSMAIVMVQIVATVKNYKFFIAFYRFNHAWTAEFLNSTSWNIRGNIQMRFIYILIYKSILEHCVQK